jgi:multidrug efflux pump subunit AcrA (membrane-fusion protein)
VIAVAGLIFAILFVRAGNQPVPASQPVAQPAAAPFSAYIAGAGIVEARGENIAVGATVPGTVLQVFVKVGDGVKAGAELFKIDDRDLQAELLTRRAAVATANAQLAVSEASLADLRNQFEMYDSIKQTDPRAVSKDEYDKRRFAMATGEANVLQARAQVDAALAGVAAIEKLIDRTMVRAPSDCEVLQVKVRAGEFAAAGVMSQPLMLLGDTSKLHVRVDVDENDAWRLKINAGAKAFLRGNSQLATACEFVRVEPYVVPKRSLTGESTERVDTRVLQVLYSFDRDALPVYVGQQMDVFIEAAPVGAASTVKVAQSP